jgi:hypothetical protein
LFAFCARRDVVRRRRQSRRFPASNRPRRGSLLDAAQKRERLVALVGEETIQAALAERHLIGQLPASVWRQLLSLIDRLGTLSWDDRKRLCARASEIMRRLLALVIVGPRATVKAMHAKLGLGS